MTENYSFEVPGRICILGDKVDLLEKPVIAAAIDLMMRFDLQKSDDSNVIFYSHDTKEKVEFKLGESPPIDINLGYWSVLYERLKDHIDVGFSLHVKSDIPIGRGLSTSAALSVGFLRAMNLAYDLKMSASEIAELAYKGENYDLGIQCGRMDQYSIAYGGVTFIYTNTNPKVEQMDISTIPIVVGDSLENRKASSVLNKIKSQIRDRNKKVLSAFKIIEKCVYEGKIALINKDFLQLGKLMDKQQEQENKLEVNTDMIDSLCIAAKRAGAFGAKQMGAGGGGCMLALCPGKQQEVANAIEKAGGKAWVFNIFNY
jgi:mevalonate kinase